MGETGCAGDANEAVIGMTPGGEVGGGTCERLLEGGGRHLYSICCDSALLIDGSSCYGCLVRGIGVLGGDLGSRNVRESGVVFPWIAL